MSHIGDFGTVREPEDPLTFGYFGTVLRTNPGLTDLALVDLVGRLVDAQKLKEYELLGVLKDMVRGLVHPDDVESLWSAAHENRQTVEDIGDMCEQIIVAVTDRPTVRPSDSSDGPPDTGGRSAGDSSLRVVRRLEHTGRPDLALIVKQTVGSRSA